MKLLLRVLLPLCVVLFQPSWAFAKPRILCVTHTAGFHHRSCEHLIPVIWSMARSSKAFDVVYTSSTALITKESLAGYDGVMFGNTSGDLPLSDENRNALIDYVKNGGAFIGTHSATDTYKSWAPYYEMIGGTFVRHPWHEEVTIEVEDPAHPAAHPLPSPWRIKDEIYIFKNYSRVHVILRLKEAPVKGEHDVAKGDYPVAWCKLHGKGRVFYTSLGHRVDVWTNPTYQAHLLGGIRWALKEDKPEYRANLNVGHPKVTSEWRRIFNGKNLNWGTDWEATGKPEKSRPHWTVQPGGVLQGTGRGSSHIYYIKEKFRNFEYRADICIDPNGNSGMYFRCHENNLQPNGQWKNWPNGYEAQINNAYSGDPKRSGTFYPKPTLRDKDIQRLLGYDKSKDKGDFWFNMHVVAVDNHFVVKLNGKVAVVHFDDKHKEGFFAFQMHHTGTVVKLKNIEVRELP